MIYKIKVLRGVSRPKKLVVLMVSLDIKKLIMLSMNGKLMPVILCVLIFNFISRAKIIHFGVLCKFTLYLYVYLFFKKWDAKMENYLVQNLRIRSERHCNLAGMPQNRDLDSYFKLAPANAHKVKDLTRMHRHPASVCCKTGSNGLSKIITLLVIVIFVVQTRCDKPSQPQVITQLQIPQVVKDFIAFKPGSYWVYRDSATGQLDSQYITSFEYSGNTASEYIYITKLSSIDSAIIEMGTDLISRKNYCHCVEDVTYDKRDKWLSRGRVWMIFPTNNLSAFDGIYPDIVQNVTTSSTLILGSNTFINVVKIHHTKNPVEGNQPENDYFSPHVGLIRKELLGTHHVWNLIRYYIVQ